MCESFGRLMGKKVCGENDGRYFGRLSDVIVSKGTNRIIGIVAKSGAPFNRLRLILRNDITRCDETHIFVRGKGEKLAGNFRKNENVQSVGNDIYKRRAVFPDGRDAGKVQNVNFDLESGVIIGFEVGTSIADDLLTGRKTCRTRDTVKMSRGRIVLEEK